ncbi:FAD dependent oxidoreductase [Macrophomina phaseolina MS6]|uniref:FAD dependent oxidoreductase n=1 Tax=Macrophomina phaseolina (strain MS6) TaxID=1126212 RepID=K2R8Q2_MACPH|nr:FAD dependent oxidoreductase [Macrophomina phaseolina MS6]
MAITNGHVLNGNSVNGHANGHSNGNGVAAHSDARPLHVIIIGAGIGGLTAAIYLRQQGHKVTVLEQSRFACELGAAVHLAPNSNGVLKRVGIDAEKFGAVQANFLTEYEMDGKVIHSLPIGEMTKVQQHVCICPRCLVSVPADIFIPKGAEMFLGEQADKIL